MEERNKNLYALVALLVVCASMITGAVLGDMYKNKRKNTYDNREGSQENVYYNDTSNDVRKDDISLIEDVRDDTTVSEDTFDSLVETEEFEGYLLESVVNYGLRQGWSLDDIELTFGGKIDPELKQKLLDSENDTSELEDTSLDEDTTSVEE